MLLYRIFLFSLLLILGSGLQPSWAKSPLTIFYTANSQGQYVPVTA